MTSDNLELRLVRIHNTLGLIRRGEVPSEVEACLIAAKRN